MSQKQLDFIRNELINDMVEEDINQYLKKYGKPLEELNDQELDNLILDLLKYPINKGKISSIFYDEIKEYYTTRINAAVAIVDSSNAKDEECRSDLIKLTYQAMLKKKCGKCSH